MWCSELGIFSLTKDFADIISAGSLLDTADGAQQYTIGNPKTHPLSSVCLYFSCIPFDPVCLCVLEVQVSSGFRGTYSGNMSRELFISYLVCVVL